MTTIHGRATKVVPHDLVCRLRCMRDPTRDLPGSRRGAQKGKQSRLVIAWLAVKAVPVDCAAVKAGRRPGFQASHWQRKLGQLRRKQPRRRITHPPARHPLIPDVDHAIQKSPRRQNDTS